MNQKKLLLLVFLLCLSPTLLFGGICCHKLQLAGWWGSVEYLLLWRKGRHLPPLVTTSPNGTAAADAGVLGLPTTTILFGDENVNNSPRSGGRFDAGIWILPCLGVGGGIFGVQEECAKFEQHGGANGLPIIARPFFNVLTGVQASELISFPGVAVNSFIKVKSTNNLWGADAYIRYPIIGKCNWSADFLIGYLFTRIDDELVIKTRSSTTTTIPIITRVTDEFETKNIFNSGLLGFVLDWDVCRFGATVIGKFGVGSMSRQVSIEGTTIVDGITFNNRGFLAQPSNIGHFCCSNTFEVVSEFSLQLRYQFCAWFWATAGYTGFFWPNVALAGDQVNLNLDPTQAIAAPQFSLVTTSFWAQGFSLGLMLSF